MIARSGGSVYLQARPLPRPIQLDRCIIFWPVSAFYGTRFNLWTNLAYFRLGLPDVFVLMIVGTIPDYVQGMVKLIWALIGSPTFRKSWETS